MNVEEGVLGPRVHFLDAKSADQRPPQEKMLCHLTPCKVLDTKKATKISKIMKIKNMCLIVTR